MSLGLEQAGFDVILGIDRDPYHVATFRRNFPLSKALCADIANLDKAEIRKLIGDIHIDLLCGGPPCQGFSHMGKRYSSDPRNALVRHFVRLVIELKPTAFLMENVPGLQASAIKSIFEDAVERLTDNGYRITNPVQALDASQFGVPQRRGRVFLIGFKRESQALFSYPTSSCKHRPSYTSVWDSIRDLPPLSGRKDLFKNDVSPYRSIPLSRLHPYAAIARGEHIDPCDMAYPRIWDTKQCSGCSRVRHRPDVVRLYAATASGAMVPSHNLPRLDPKGLSPTLRAGTDSEHGSFNAPRPIHPYEPRCITVREAARLHGYPDWFRFFPAKWHAHRQIGNSVCPPVARAIGFAIRRALRLRVSKPSQALQLHDTFELAKRRGNRIRRISQLGEWPKILAHLLFKAGLSANGRLRKPTFSVGDVAQAYRLTGARMPRTPPGRLLADIARSRNRHALLAETHRQGFSIAHVGKSGLYGRFVPIGTAGSLECTTSLMIGRAEVKAARPMANSKGVSSSFRKTVAFLQRPSVRKALLSNRRLVVADSAPRRVQNRTLIYCAVQSKTRRQAAIVTQASHRALPELAAVGSLLAKTNARICIIVTAVTKRHLGAVVVARRGARLRVKGHCVFEISAV